MSKYPTYVCTFTVQTYGTSGTELPPPIKASTTVSVLSNPDEKYNDFSTRMADFGMEIRKTFTGIARPYSSDPSITWRLTTTGSLLDLSECIEETSCWRPPMNIYLVQNPLPGAKLHSMVCIAPDEGFARYIHPHGGFFHWQANNWRKFFPDGTWEDGADLWDWPSPSQLSVALLGTALEGSSPSVILSVAEALK